MADRNRWVAFALLATTQFVLILDAAIVNVALPSMGRDLGFAQEDLSWVSNAYLLTFGGFLLLGGRIADFTGRRRMFIAGLTVFAVASFAGALATSAIWLVIARAFQGLGGALVAPAALALVMTLFPEGADRNRALGLWGAVAGSGGAAGVILGGLLTEWLGWESVLYVNVPIGIAAIALAPRLLPEARDPAGTRSFDLAGAVSVTAGLGLLVYTLVDATDAGWGSSQTIGLGALALALLAAFIGVERRAARPLVPLGVLGRRTLRGANILLLITTMTMFPTFLVLTLYLQQVLGYGPIKAGLAQLPIALAIVAAAGPASKVVTRIGYKTPIIAGLVVIAVALTWFSRITASGGYAPDVLVPSIIAGLGGAFVFVPVTIAATTGAAPHEAGLASGLLNTTQQVGGALGIAVLIALATARTESVLAAGERVPAVALTEGFQAALLGGAGLALTGAVLASVLLSSRESRAAVVAQGGEEQAREPVSV